MGTVTRRRFQSLVAGGNLAQSYRNTSARRLLRDWEPFVLGNGGWLQVAVG